jgi:hypothetical protein
MICPLVEITLLAQLTFCTANPHRKRHGGDCHTKFYEDYKFDIAFSMIHFYGLIHANSRHDRSHRGLNEQGFPAYWLVHCPPLALTRLPVIQLDSGLQTMPTIPATSSGYPTLPPYFSPNAFASSVSHSLTGERGVKG